MKIPLFDVDGTLFKAGGKVQHDTFGYAFKKVYGINATKDDAGVVERRVDNEIITNVLKVHGLNGKEIKAKIKLATKAMSEYFISHIDEANLQVLPGVVGLLKKLKERGATVGLLTGNVEDLAWAKLRKTGIRDFFDFGAFGDSVYRRVDLVEIARQKAEKILKREVKTKELLIIGDTPKDIKCAKDAGVKVIAVATGFYSFEDLGKENPDLVVHTLEEQKTIIDFTFS